MKKAAFAAGCFWGVEAAFRKIRGVEETAVGYMSGRAENPTYGQVCSGKTGHAEAVLVRYDPSVVSYDELLKAFWGMHDLTTANRQGPDVGSQYRSAIFFYGEAQRTAALASKKKEQERYKESIVTEIAPASSFWRAEEYHQHYFEKHGAEGYHV